MKKSIFAGIAIFLASFCVFSENPPAFDGENAFVIDTATIAGKFKDNVVLVNKTQEETCAVAVFAYIGNAWKEIGRKSFGAFDEELKIKSKKPIKLADSTYFAVQAQNGFSATYKVAKESNDLYIEVRSEGSDLSKPACPPFPNNPKAFVFDAATLGDEADESLRIRGYVASSGEVTFRVFAYDSDKRTWILWGTADIGYNGDSEKVKGGKHDDLDEYRYFSVEALDGRDYKYMPLIEGDDLFINVSF